MLELGLPCLTCTQGTYTSLQLGKVTYHKACCVWVRAHHWLQSVVIKVWLLQDARSFLTITLS